MPTLPHRTKQTHVTDQRFWKKLAGQLAAENKFCSDVLVKGAPLTLKQARVIDSIARQKGTLSGPDLLAYEDLAGGS